MLIAPQYASPLAASERPERASASGDLPPENSRLRFLGDQSGQTLLRVAQVAETAPGCDPYGYNIASGRPLWSKFDPLGLRVVYVQLVPHPTLPATRVPQEFTPNENQQKNFDNALAGMRGSSDVGRQMAEKIDSKDYTLTIVHDPDGVSTRAEGPSGGDNTITLDLDHSGLMSPSARQQLIKNRVEEGKIKNEADGNNQLSSNGAVVLGHEAGHAVLGKKDEAAGGDNVQTVENPIRKGVGEEPWQNYHQTPVPQETATQAQQNAVVKEPEKPKEDEKK